MEKEINGVNVPAAQEKETLPSIPSIFGNIQRFEEAQRIAKLLSESDMVPAHFQKKIANCMIALQLAERMRVDSFMLMQNMYIVHGRPAIEGKLAIALIEGTGRYSPLKYRFSGSGKTDKGVVRPDSCVAYATELKTGEVIEGPPVTWETATLEGWTKNKGEMLSKWNTMPDLMFRYRSAMFFARTNCPGALLGLKTTDELDDIVELEEVSPGVYSAPEIDDLAGIDPDPVVNGKKLSEMTREKLEWTFEKTADENVRRAARVMMKKPRPPIAPAAAPAPEPSAGSPTSSQEGKPTLNDPRQKTVIEIQAILLDLSPLAPMDALRDYTGFELMDDVPDDKLNEVKVKLITKRDAMKAEKGKGKK